MNVASWSAFTLIEHYNSTLSLSTFNSLLNHSVSSIVTMLRFVFVSFTIFIVDLLGSVIKLLIINLLLLYGKAFYVYIFHILY